MLDNIILMAILSTPIVSMIGIIYALRVINKINEQSKNRMRTQYMNIKHISSLADEKKSQFEFNWKLNQGFTDRSASDS